MPKAIQTRRPLGAGRPMRRSSPSLPNARSNYERYITLARAAASKGDKVQMEDYYQHAEHFLRLMRTGPDALADPA